MDFRIFDQKYKLKYISIRNSLLIKAIVLCNITLFTQSLVTNKDFEIRHFLPGELVYSTVVDSTKNVWSLTENGLLKWEDKGFEYYSPINKIKASFFDLFVGSEDKIWLSSFSKYLVYLQNNKVHLLDSTLTGSKRILDASNKNIVFGNSDEDILLYKTDKSLIKKNIDSVFIKKPLRGHLINLTDTSFLYKDHNLKESQNFYILNKDLEIEEKLSLDIKTFDLRYGGLQLVKLYVLNIIDYNQLEYYLTISNKSSVHLSKDRNHTIIFIKDFIHIYHFKKGRCKQKEKVLNQLNITPNILGGFFEDIEGNLWISTLNNGIFQIPYYYKYTSRASLNNKLSFNKSIIVNNNKSIFLYNNTKNEFKKIFKSNFNDIKDVVEVGQHLIVVSNTGGNHTIIDKETLKSEALQQAGLIKKIYLLDSEKLMILRNKSIDLAYLKNKQLFTKKKYNIYRPEKLIKCNSNEYLISSKKGVYLINLKTGLTFLNDNIGVVKDLFYNNSKPSILTQQGLVYEYSVKKKLFHINNKLSNKFTSIIQFDKLLLVKKDKTSIHDTNVVDKGIILDEELKALLNNRSIIPINQKELLLIGNNDIIKHQYKHSTPKILYYQTNNFDNKPMRDIKFYEGDKITFNFKVKTLFNLNEFYVNHQLNSFNKIDESNVNKKSIDISNLKKGDYTLYYKLFTPDKRIETDLIKTKIKVIPHWWNSIWFFIVIVLLAAFSVFLLLRFFFKIKYKNQGIKYAFLKTQLLSLQNQINPHFFANSLSGVQELFLSNKKNDANEYVASLGSFSRKIILASSHDIWLLNKEISLIKDYLDLEKRRFSDKVDYVLNIDDNLNTNHIYIPTMLLQPIIENSFKHGVTSDGNFMLSVTFNKREEGLVVDIKDNGKGFSSSSKNKRGVGIKLISNKIELINKLYSTTIKFKNLSFEMEKGSHFCIITPLKLIDSESAI